MRVWIFFLTDKPQKEGGASPSLPRNRMRRTVHANDGGELSRARMRGVADFFCQNKPRNQLINRAAFCKSNFSTSFFVPSHLPPHNSPLPKGPSQCGCSRCRSRRTPPPPLRNITATSATSLSGISPISNNVGIFASEESDASDVSDVVYRESSCLIYTLADTFLLCVIERLCC